MFKYISPEQYDTIIGPASTADRFHDRAPGMRAVLLLARRAIDTDDDGTALECIEAARTVVDMSLRVLGRPFDVFEETTLNTVKALEAALVAVHHALMRRRYPHQAVCHV
jgi:hypothetical protein